MAVTPATDHYHRRSMEDLPRRLAEFLESLAARIRALTVDRIAKGVTIVSLAIPLAVFGLLALVFLFLTIHRALAIPLTDAGAYGVMAGLFVVVGAFLWRKRSGEPEV